MGTLMKKEFIQRKPNRLKDYDYSQNGCYFITICTKEKRPILSEVLTLRGDDPAPKKQIVLKDYGKTVDKYINSIHSAYNSVYIENYIIMPNHIHILLLIDTNGLPGSSAPTVSNVISALKHLANKQAGFNLWQRSFYDHIIRNETDFQNTWNYIEYNALKEYGKK